MPHKDPEKRRQYNKQYEATRIRDQSSRRKYNRERARPYRQRIKVQVLTAYGGAVCVCCRETHIEFLTLDHVDKNGPEDRRTKGSGSVFYQWLRHHNYPDLHLRVLCMNCNFALGHSGYCPHDPIKSIQHADCRRPTKDVLGSVPVSTHASRQADRIGIQLDLIGLGDDFSDGT